MDNKYIPLYRKYRPQTLEELVGQEHIKNALTNAIKLNKISHAYLFTGPRGTGKTSTARIFAKSLNCKNGPTITPCGECESCVDITNSVPMDVIEIDAASNRKVEDTQNILEKILYAPVYGKYKIYIIDEVHMLSNTAFNSLLKTLEEPPENVIFILATTEVHKVLDTIKSRCQRFDFRRITTADIVKHLRYIADKESINITDDALYTIAKNSAGGMRDSIALLDQLSVLGGKDAITTEDINKLLGRISFDVLKKLTDAIVSSNPQTAVEILENIYNSGNEPVQILTNLLDYLKNLLITKNCKKDIVFELTQLNEAQVEALTTQAKDLETHQIVSLVNKCADYIKELKLTNNPRLWLEISIIDLSNLAENTTLDSLQSRLSALEGGAQPIQRPQIKQNVVSKPIEPVKKSESAEKPAPVAQTEVKESKEVVSKPEVQTTEEDFSPMPKAQVSDNSNNLEEVWDKLLASISSSATRSPLAQHGNPIELNSERVVISLRNDIFLKMFAEGTRRDNLVAAIKEMFGHTNLITRLPEANDVPVHTGAVKKKPITPPTTNQPEKKEEELPAEEIEELREESEQMTTPTNTTKSHSMHSDMVNMVVELFDGKIIE